MPVFSVIMPAKDRAKLIPEPIKSLINQTFSDFELIIIDDHSTDETAEVVKKFTDPRIKYYPLTDGTGPGAGRDFGIKKALGKYIVVADSDDINYPDRLEKTKEKFDDGFDVVYSNVDIDNIETGEKYLRPSQAFDPELIKRVNFIPAPTTAFKKEAYIEVGGFDKNLMTSEDYDLWLKMTENNKKFGYIDQPLVKMQVTDHSTTQITHSSERKKNLRKIREKHNLNTPNVNKTLKMIINPKLKKLLSTKEAIIFWFS